jgi:hypothetical protein
MPYDHLKCGKIIRTRRAIDVLLGSSFLMLNSVKEKSWSVLLIKGFVLNDQVKAEHCENCKSKSEVLTTNFNNPNLFLYGCKDSKCKHRFLRLDFNDKVPPNLSSSSFDKKSID